MIKAIIFDIGGTFLQGNCQNFINKAQKILGLENDINISEATFDENLIKGKIEHEECFRAMFKVPINDQQMQEILSAWTTNWILTREMAHLVKSLEKNYILAVLSNSDSLNAENYQRKGWYDYFDHLILSHELGIIKPDRRIYEISLEKIKLPAEQCLFIDDQEEILLPAKDIGMGTIHFKSFDQLRNDLILKGISI